VLPATIKTALPVEPLPKTVSFIQPQKGQKKQKQKRTKG
jgi:hypothetical protein